jgi:hypothetical protein
MTKTFAEWMVHDPGLAAHEEAFRTTYGPGADQYMDLATLNLRLKGIGIDYEVPEEAAAPAGEAQAAPASTGRPSAYKAQQE